MKLDIGITKRDVGRFEMNERINSLAEQADEFADNEIRMPGEYHPDWHNVRDQKFAELIVKECADFADEHNSEVEGVTLGVGKAIKQHFGVNV